MILSEQFDDCMLEVLDSYSLTRSMQRAKTGIAPPRAHTHTHAHTHMHTHTCTHRHTATHALYARTHKCTQSDAHTLRAHMHAAEDRYGTAHRHVRVQTHLLHTQAHALRVCTHTHNLRVRAHTIPACAHAGRHTEGMITHVMRAEEQTRSMHTHDDDALSAYACQCTRTHLPRIPRSPPPNLPAHNRGARQQGVGEVQHRRDQVFGKGRKGTGRV